MEQRLRSEVRGGTHYKLLVFAETSRKFLFLGRFLAIFIFIRFTQRNKLENLQKLVMGKLQAEKHHHHHKKVKTIVGLSDNLNVHRLQTT